MSSSRTPRDAIHQRVAVVLTGRLIVRRGRAGLRRPRRLLLLPLLLLRHSICKRAEG